MFPNSIATVCYDFGDFYRSTCEPRIRASGGNWQTSPCYDDLSLRAIEHQPHKPDVNPADFIQFPLGGRAESLRRALGRRLSQAGIRGTGSRARVSSCLLLKDHRRPADSLSLKVDGHLDTVGDLDERNAFIHPVVFTVESHCPLNLT